MLPKIALLSLALVLSANAQAIDVDHGNQIPPKDHDYTDLIIDLTGGDIPVPNPPLLYITPLGPAPAIGIPDMAEYAVRPMEHREESLTMTDEVEDVLAEQWVVNINTAPASLLSRVPLIGPIRAESIVNHRYANGSFRRPCDIREVFGITDWHYVRLAHHLVCEGQTTYTIPELTPVEASPSLSSTATASAPTTQPTLR